MQETPHVLVLHHRFDPRSAPADWKGGLAALPPDSQRQAAKYHQWQDAYRYMAGRLMVRHGLQTFGFQHDILSEIQHTEYGRPFVSSSVDFNISHSGDFIVVAFSKQLRVGIDIEEIRKVDLLDFHRTMSAPQWKDIHSHKDRMSRFFQYWAVKESVVKASGEGFSTDLTDIDTDFKQATSAGRIWHLRKLRLDQGYASYLSTDQSGFNLKKLPFVLP